MKPLIVSAPGKVILHGEHAVVYGKKALASSLNLRTFLKLHLSQENHIINVNFPDINIEKRWLKNDIWLLNKGYRLCDVKEPQSPGPEMILALRHMASIGDETLDTKQLALLAFLYLYNAILQNKSESLAINVVVASYLPTGAGLGSSAAFSTCLSAAFLTHAGIVQQLEGDGNCYWKKEDLELINKWAFEAEKIIHGNPSGIDNSVSTYGGAVILQNGKLSFLERIPELRIFLLNTKIPRSTKLLVASVRERYNKYPEIIGPVLDSIEAISTKCIEIFNKFEETLDNYDNIKDLVEMNHYQLCLLGVSHPALEEIISVARKFNITAKLTGAGGGGCAFAIIPPSINESTISDFQSKILSMGYECFETSIGVPGVMLHNNADNSLKAPTAIKL